jgi:hypothetical protein
MATPPESAEQDIRLLDELSALGMAMARDLQARCLAVGDAREAADLALGFQRASRSVRQCIALKAQLERDRARQDRDERDERAQGARVTAERVKAHMAKVRSDVKRIVWNELEPADAKFMLTELDEQIAEMALGEDFCALPVNIHVMRICAELGVFENADDWDDDLPASSTSPGACGPHPQASVEAEGAGLDEAARRSSA